MNPILIQFLQYNLLPSLVAGTLAWVVIYAAISVLKIEFGPLRLTLLFIPLVKSVLILLGIGLVLPWPRDVFQAWHARALPYNLVLPYLLVWAGIALLARSMLIQRAREMALRDAVPAEKAAPRLVESLERVKSAFDSCQVPMVGGGLVCCVHGKLPDPQLLVSEGGLDSPLVLTSEDTPTIVFPLKLVSELDDDELDGALGHEMAHFTLRRPACCSPTYVNNLSPMSPIAQLVAKQLKREEEKACDDMAIASLGKPEVYAGMLLKSYRFATKMGSPFANQLQALPQLLGFKPDFTERVERLLAGDPPQKNLWLQSVVSCALSVGAYALFFVTF